MKKELIREIEDWFYDTVAAVNTKAFTLNGDKAAYVTVDRLPDAPRLEKELAHVSLEELVFATDEWLADLICSARNQFDLADHEFPMDDLGREWEAFIQGLYQHEKDRAGPTQTEHVQEAQEAH